MYQGSGVMEMDELLPCPSLLSPHTSLLVQRMGGKAVLASKTNEMNLEVAIKIFFFWLVGFSPSLVEIVWLQTPLSQVFSKKFLTFIIPNRLTKMLLCALFDLNADLILWERVMWLVWPFGLCVSQRS